MVPLSVGKKNWWRGDGKGEGGRQLSPAPSCPWLPFQAGKGLSNSCLFSPQAPNRQSKALKKSFISPQHPLLNPHPAPAPLFKLLNYSVILKLDAGPSQNFPKFRSRIYLSICKNLLAAHPYCKMKTGERGQGGVGSRSGCRGGKN